MARVLIVDDHAAYRCGLQCLLQPVLDDCQFEQASNLAEALTLLRQPSPFTVTIFDWHLPDSGGVKGLLALLRVCAGQPVLVVTGDPDEAIGIAAASLGADACLPKSASAQALRTQVAHLLHPNPSNGTPRRSVRRPRPGSGAVPAAHPARVGHPHRPCQRSQQQGDGPGTGDLQSHHPQPRVTPAADAGGTQPHAGGRLRRRPGTAGP